MTRRASRDTRDETLDRPDTQALGSLVARAPHDEDAEQAVLAAMLFPGPEGAAAVRAARERLTPEDFYRAAHGTLFRALLAVSDAGRTVDPLTVADHLTAAGALKSAGGRDYLAWLTDAVPTAANAGHHAAIVARLAAKRRVWAACLEGAAQAADPKSEPAACAAAVAEALRPQAAAGRQGGFRSAHELSYRALEEVERRAQLAREGRGVGLSLGYPEMDDACGGAEPGDLVTLLMVSGHGKTALQLGMARGVAVHGDAAVAIVEAEMAAEQLMFRLYAPEAGVAFWKLRKGRLVDDDYPRLARAAGLIGSAALWVDDAPLPHVDQVTARVRALKADHPSLTHVVVDYVQLLSDDAELRAEQLDRIPAKLKALAKELGVVVIQSAQPDGKLVDRRAADHMPQLADVAWGQGVRNASDTVICGYRPGMYEPVPDNLARFRVEKSRASGRAEFELDWHGETMDYRSRRRSYGLQHLALVPDAREAHTPQDRQADLYTEDPAA